MSLTTGRSIASCSSLLQVVTSVTNLQRHDCVLALQGEDALSEHCVIQHVDGEVTLEPAPQSYVTVNDVRISSIG